MAEHDPVLVEKAAEPIARADGYMTDGEARSCARAVLDAVASAIRETALLDLLRAAERHAVKRSSFAGPSVESVTVAELRDMAEQKREEQADGR